METIRAFTANFLHDVGAFRLWERQKADLIRMVLFELTWNAFRHGDATFAEIASSRFRLTLRADARDFSLADLRARPITGGGNAAVLDLERRYGDTLKFRYRYTKGRARWEIADISSGGPSDNPCGVGSNRLNDAPLNQLAYLNDCDEIHVYAQDNWSYSDSLATHRAVQRLGRTRKIVVHNVSPDSILAHYLIELGNVRLAK
ncbi:hypothetical protein ACIBTW_00725 [Micromonospora parva]|uniref:hypothetical protein n=1 Tax=Micromonospora parva TaxID=1464048 RepID=UPI00378F94F5